MPWEPGGAPAFESEEDSGLFLKTQGEVCARTDWKVHALALMSTHYHLLLEAPNAELVEGMKWYLGRSRSIVERKKDLARRYRSRKRALDETKTTQITG